ncbi:hypothetical protein SRHO_G00097950 [Serrasalmus rhombeus]
MTTGTLPEATSRFLFHQLLSSFSEFRPDRRPSNWIKDRMTAHAMPGTGGEATEGHCQALSSAALQGDGKQEERAGPMRGEKKTRLHHGKGLLFVESVSFMRQKTEERDGDEITTGTVRRNEQTNKMITEMKEKRRKKGEG